MEPNEVESLIISLEEEGGRLDTVLKNRFPSLSRTYMQFLIGEGAVLVNGEIVKKRTSLREGDEVEICFILTPAIDLTPQDIPLDILFEDEHILIVNKPLGMVVHPAPGHHQGTFVNALLHHCNLQSFDKEDIRPGIVHRLDKDTTGVLVAAKTKEAHRLLIEQFSSRAVKKTYFAFCIGNPGDCVIDAPLGRHPTKRKEMAIVEGGKPAVTVCKTLAHVENIAFVELDLITGRTHQIRVHLKHIGTPVLGDPVYGSLSTNTRLNILTQLLHASRIEFIHPITSVPLSITAPMPQSMVNLSRKLGISITPESLPV
jgi:23S rRNA pseudouridine1911/1915/1917 synthase